MKTMTTKNALIFTFSPLIAVWGLNLFLSRLEYDLLTKNQREFYPTYSIQESKEAGIYLKEIDVDLESLNPLEIESAWIEKRRILLGSHPIFHISGGIMSGKWNQGLL